MGLRATLAIPLLLAMSLTPAGAQAVKAAPGPVHTPAQTAGARVRVGPVARPYSFARSFRLQGHVNRPNPFTTPAARAFQRKMQTVNLQRVAVFGRVVTQQKGLLLIRQIPWQVSGKNGARIAFAHTASAAVPGTAPVPVSITAHTLVQARGGMSGLHAGMPVFIGGSMANGRLSASIISSLQKAAGTVPLFRALSGRRLSVPRSLAPRPTRRPVALDNSLNFTGEFGGPSFNYNTDLGDIDIFDVGVVTVYLRKFSFLASLDGWTYNWPMNFTGSPASPLVMTEQNAVNLNVIPQPGGNGIYTDTFSGGIGVNVGIGFHIYTAVGCGTADLESCHFDHTVDLGVGLLNETQDPAPLASGQDLNVPSVDCPNVGFKIPDTPISAADVGLCNTFLIHGANFSAQASATGADMTPTSLNFDGSNAQSVPLTPTSTPVDVSLSNFLWDPTLDYGLHPRIRVLLQTVWSGPSVTLVSGSFPMIADAATRSAEGFNDVEGQFAQPTSTDFLFPASKEGTAITSGSPTSGDYNDPAIMSATLKDRLGRALIGKTLSFELNNNPADACQGTTNLFGVASCSITPTDMAGPGTLAINFAGDAQYFSSSATPDFTINREESTLTYTGDPLIANNRSALLKAVLKEDGSTAPVPAGQSVVFTLGTGSAAQTCTGTTDSTGLAQCTIATVNQPLGTEPVAAAFNGDNYYLPASDSQQRLVFSYLPAGGSFALGDNSVAAATSSSPMYFWGAQWWSQNSLSGGSAPSSFKGFVQTFSPAGDPTCGASWTAAPANSPPPPATVPSYMAVVVPGTVAKSSSTIMSGDTKKIVIVKTNPGYGPDPSQIGTGTIVATLCSS